MWKSKIILLLCLISAKASFGQFGNEWINFNQEYYKFKITEEGFYRITQEELAAIGFPVSTVQSSRIQLFREGQEVAINVNQTGGVLNYLEFYGYGKDGTSDTPLYEDGGQPHTFYNLFTDSASYFLTYLSGGESDKRIPFSNDANSTGLTPEAYHLQDTLQLFTSNYSDGIKFGDGSAFTLSSFVEGEGWTGPQQSKNQFRDYDFLLEDLEDDTDIILESVISGRNSLDHNVDFSAGENNTSLVDLDNNATFTGWGFTNYSETIPATSIGSGGELTIRALVEGFPDAADQIAISYMRVIYPQTIAMSDAENKVFNLDDPTARRSWLQIGTSNASNTTVFNITDPFNAVRLATTNFSDRVEVVVPDVSVGNKLIAVTNPSSVGTIEPVNFSEIDFSETNYLIITDPLLRSGGDPVADYQAYRESETGGGYSVQVLETDEIYDLFGYGDLTSLAISNLIEFANSQNPLEHIFIIGKGFTPQLKINNSTYESITRADSSFVNIPTYGSPGTDLLYSVGVNADEKVPGIPVGRLNATETSQVASYLNKIVEMEALPYDDLFRKDFLQLSGGQNKAEIDAFINYVQGFTTRLEDDFIGGRAFNTGKETGEAVEFIDVSDRINQGVGYVTLFGHSSGTVTDIEIGRPSNPEFGFTNQGKYPIILVNGCQAGEIFGSNFTFGEDWTLTPDLGAIGFIAHTRFAFSSTLRLWSNLFYDVGFGDDVFIGSTLGEVMIEVSDRYFTQYGMSDLSLTQVRQMQLQGDPAIRIFGADSPDYFINNDALSSSAIDADEILASQDTFKIDIIVTNFGRSITDSLVIQLNRSFPDGSQATYIEQFPRVLRQDTIEFFVPNDPTRVNEGVNLFSVTLDPQNVEMELNETNNSATLEVSIFDGNTTHLYPIPNGTESENTIEFIWQSSNLLEDERTYDLEFDTRADFAGPNSRSVLVTGEVIMRHNFDFSSLSLEDTTTIYWRTRFAETSENESNEWTESSFTLIGSTEGGWGQYDAEQIDPTLLTGIDYDQNTNEWEFIQTTTPIDILTIGANHPDLTQDDMYAFIGGIDFFISSNTIDPVCASNTFNAIAFDKETGNPFRPIETTGADVNNDEVCGRLPQQIYQFEEVDLIGSERRLDVLVNNMRDGDQIVLFNIGEVIYSNWDATVVATLNSLGISTTTISSLTDGQPVIFFGRKGDTPGSATVVFSDGSATPITEQSLSLTDNAFGSFTSGQIKSTRIGPAQSWDSFSFSLTDEVNDNYALDLYGITLDGETNSFVSRTKSETVDVGTIDPVLYPQVELVLTFDDETDQTPPQLNYWEVNYSYPAEGLPIPISKEVQSLNEGAEIAREFGFVNISEVDFSDSLTVMARLINQTSGTALESSFRIAAPQAGDTTFFTTAFSSFDMSGDNSLIVEVQANENEAYTINNRLTLTNIINVQADETNPIIDVTFDGFHILDGDIVSPNPIIAIQMRDDNPFALKTDTIGFNLSLRLPGETSQFQRVNFSDPRLTFMPATENEDLSIEYQPGPLEDGVYALRVQAEDDAGNEAGAVPYEINFEVLNESTITHFYPYPNPFSTNCRFVFTLTGSEIPDEIKIQIMTISGRIVREITQDEIGPIRIGNNITSYAWDGRDEFGDQLANGVYFYKVFINANGSEVTQRATSADRAFKHGFGKLYILR